MTPQQSDFIAACRGEGNLLLDARAGTGKTTTLIHAMGELPSPILALAFNKSIAQELSRRIPEDAYAKTFNGLGHATWQRQLGHRPIVNQSKVYEILQEVAEDAPADPWPFAGDIIGAVQAAKNSGIVPSDAPMNPKGLAPDTDETWEEIAEAQDIPPRFIPMLRQMLLLNIRRGLQGDIDFADQLYLPVVYRAPFPRGQYKTLVVDEAQDLSPLQHKMVEKSLGKGARLIAAGDPYQAIYGFRGARSDSLSAFHHHFSMTAYPLSVTFRCPKAVVQEVTRTGHVEDLEAGPDNPQGAVEQATGSPEEGSLVLCRLNGPLFNLAMHLLAEGTPCQMLGRDLHRNLRKIAERNRGDSLAATASNLKSWADAEIASAKTRGKQNRIQDQLQALLAIVNGCSQVSDLLENLDLLYKNGGPRTITLSTIHRIKGAEHPVVYLYRPDLIPSPMASESWEIQQEENLLYVAQTRATQRLIYLEDQ